MKNLDQIRAKNALDTIKLEKEFRGEDEGDVLTGLPALIIGNGLLATIAFAKSKDKKDRKSAHTRICDAIARHLADPTVGLLFGEEADTDGLLGFLTRNDSNHLRLCTAEALAYLNYLRRFAKAQVERKV